ncbi:MAG: hypothetical protein VYE22_03635 [Myxococcota bacterium]|nr:hypothetical protein [Myxococcota bacterium]
MSWQVVAAGLVWLAAVAYLVWKMAGRRKKPRVLQKPDVKASDLVRDQRTRRGSRKISSGD